MLNPFPSCRLHSPHVLLGYERTRQQTAAGADVAGGGGGGSGGRGKDATYVNLYLTIEPPLKVRRVGMIPKENWESDSILQDRQPLL